MEVYLLDKVHCAGVRTVVLYSMLEIDTRISGCLRRHYMQVPESIQNPVSTLQRAHSLASFFLSFFELFCHPNSCKALAIGPPTRAVLTLQV